MPNVSRRVALGMLLALLCGPSLAAASTEDPIAKGDRAWASRAETVDGRLADPERSEAAVRHYRAALDADPASLEARWKLLRALHYVVEFTDASEDRTQSAMQSATDLARDSVERLDEDRGADADRARVSFWSAIAWGARAQRVGLLTIVREGVATRMRDLAERSLDVDPGVDQGGALRLLSRLHGDLPRVPFVSGWVDRERALPLAERAYEQYPDHVGNPLVLALALLAEGDEHRDRARALLERARDAPIDPGMRVEQLAIREQAREALADLDAS